MEVTRSRVRPYHESFPIGHIDTPRRLPRTRAWSLGMVRGRRLSRRSQLSGTRVSQYLVASNSDDPGARVGRDRRDSDVDVAQAVSPTPRARGGERVRPGRARRPIADRLPVGHPGQREDCDDESRQGRVHEAVRASHSDEFFPADEYRPSDAQRGEHPISRR